ncbi:HAD family acid phosphatase [Sphingomonas sp. PB4P5]|uniref:HAD family acid phosphatase n=1 Tax=Parasphingomonas puruogangriensis TaxID=3096155 RepID=UPI002FC76B0F
MLALGACATVQPSAPAPTIPPGMQYLYGSGEAAALSVQAWQALTRYVRDQKNLVFRAAGTRVSVILSPTATLAAPEFERCGMKPLAAVFDVDETVLLNLGFEANDAAHPAPYDEARWQSWERTGATQVSAVPGAARALTELRAMGVTVIFNSNRAAANADATAAAITGAGLGSAIHGETLFLSGDDAMGSKKDGRRAMIAARYCVIAMGGDQLGDFSDLFNAGLTPPARRAATLAPAIAAKWGNGWFVLPNPVYGSGLKGGLDDVFPLDKRWAPPAIKEGAE